MSFSVYKYRVFFESFVLLSILYLLMYAQVADADMFGKIKSAGNQQQAETKIGDVIAWGIGMASSFAVAGGLMKSAWGLAEVNGWFGDENKGADSIKKGLVIAGIGAVATSLVAAYVTVIK